MYGFLGSLADYYQWKHFDAQFEYCVQCWIRGKSRVLYGIERSDGSEQYGLAGAGNLGGAVNGPNDVWTARRSLDLPLVRYGVPAGASSSGIAHKGNEILRAALIGQKPLFPSFQDVDRVLHG